MRVFALYRRGAAWAYASRFRPPAVGELGKERAEPARREADISAKTSEARRPLSRPRRR